MESNVVLEFCDFLARLKHLTVAELAFSALEFGNVMLGGKHDNHINFLRDTYDLSGAILDENGKLRPTAQLYTRGTATRLNAFIKSASDYSDAELGTDFNSRTRQQVEADMSRIAQLSYRRALNQEVSSCPTPNNTSSDYEKIYNNEVVPQQENIEQYDAMIEFYSRALSTMGAKISSSDDEHKEYLKSLSYLQVKSFSYKIEVQSVKVDSVKKRKLNVSDDADPMEPRTEEYTVQIDKKFQTFCGQKSEPKDLTASCPLDENPEYLTKFLADYQYKWKTWTMGQAPLEKRGFLDSPIVRVEDRFKDFHIICNKGKIREKYDPEDPDTFDNIEKDYQACINESNESIDKTGDLLTYYATELVDNIRKKKMAQGHLWTFESYHLGSFRNVQEASAEDSAGVYAQEKVECSPITNLGLLQQKQAETMAINAEINQMLVEKAFEQNALMQAKEEEEKRKAEERERRLLMEEELERRRNLPYTPNVSFPKLENPF